MEGEYIKKGAGRPKIPYEEWMCDKVVEVMANGGHITTAATACGVSKNTFKRLVEENPDLRDALSMGEQLSQEYYEKLLRQCASGISDTGGAFKGNFKALEFILKNKGKGEWGTTGDESKTNINIHLSKPLHVLEEELKNLLECDQALKEKVINGPG